MKKREGKLPDQQTETMEDAAMLEQRIAQWEDELMQKGIAEGLLLGEKKGKAEGLLLGEKKGKAEGLLQQKTILLEMLSKRFGNFPQEWLDGIEQLSDANSIGRLMVALLTVKTSDEFEEMLTTFQ